MTAWPVVINRRRIIWTQITQRNVCLKNPAIMDGANDSYTM